MIVASATWWIWGKPGWGTAELWAAAILLLPSAVSILLAAITRGKTRPRFFSRLISGQDGKWSTSKAGYLFWTYALLFAGIATLVHRGDLGSIFAHLQPEYLVILGIPASTGAAAKAIRNQNPGTNGSGAAADPNTNPVTGISELVADDEGDTALHKFQYLAFNLLLLGFFFAQFFANENGGLPKLPPTLVGLTGVGAAAYLAQKGLGTAQETGATIRNILPREASAGSDIVIYGANLATPAWPLVHVLVGGQAASVKKVSITDPVTTVTATIPPGTTSGTTTITAIAYDGTSSNPFSFDVT